MLGELEFRHVGGGQKGLFLAVRYVFVTSVAYLLVFQPQAQPRPLAPVYALTIAGALASNVALSFLPSGMLFAARMAAPLLIADTVWVAWALHAAGAMGGEFFVLYSFVLLLAAVGEDPVMVVLGATVASAVSIYAGGGDTIWTSAALLRIVVLFTAALFYGHALARIKRERQRGDRSLEWALALEAKVAERTAELNRLYESSRTAGKAKSEFMASMSHELRTPLHIVIGYADMLLDEARATSEETGTLAGHIRRAATGLLHLVDGVLEMARLESGRVRVDRRAVRLGEFAEELRQREWLAPQPGVRLRWDFEPCSTEIETDPTKLQVILSNLVTNALKYTREGEVAVSMRTREHALRVDFQVDDTGSGIPGPQLARLREPFHESSGASAHPLEGIGLGLAIVYGYADLLGADVSVHSAVGHGTSFRVAVPYRPPDAPQAAAEQAA